MAPGVAVIIDPVLSDSSEKHQTENQSRISEIIVSAAYIV